MKKLKEFELSRNDLFYDKVEAKSYKEAIEYFKKAHKGKGSFEITVIGESEKIKRIRL
jgi:hypothetical protein